MLKWSQSSLGLILFLISSNYASAWSGDGSPGSGYVVDRNDRNDVLSFYHAVYQASEGFENRIGWTGNYTTPTAGTTSTAFVNDVQRRVNYYRAMVGVPADVQFNTGSKVIIQPEDTYAPSADTTKAAASQQAALMMALSYNSTTGANPAFVHEPPNTVRAWTAAAWNANHRGNITYRVFGPRAVDVYFKEDGVSNAGHRRYLMHRQYHDFATGDTPGGKVGSDVIPSSNNIYITNRNEEANISVPRGFFPYPNAGFFPVPLNTNYWSLSYGNADFSAATVTMTRQGGASTVIPSADISRLTGYGENAIVWKVDPAAAVTSLDSDLTYEVTVSNIGNVPGITSYTYSVTLISPNRLVDPQVLTGAAEPPTAGANYVFSPVSHADELEMAAFKISSASWTEAAEPSSTPMVVNQTSSNYDFIASVSMVVSKSTTNFFLGSRSFRLTFGDLPLRTEMFEVDRDIVPISSPKLLFSYRMGYMMDTTSLWVEQSNDGGSTWSVVKKIVGTGTLNQGTSSNNWGFANVSDASLTAGVQPIRVRFRLVYTGENPANPGVYTHAYAPDLPTGIFIDGISTSGCQWYEKKGSVALGRNASQASFNASVAGSALTAATQYQLRLRAKMEDHWFAYGPLKQVTVTSTPLVGYASWEYEYPTMAGTSFDGDSNGDGIKNGIKFAFSLDPTSRQTWADNPVVDSVGNRLQISRPLSTVRSGITYGAEWSDDLVNWATIGVSVNISGDQVVASVPMTGRSRYLRWKITSP